MQVGQGFQGLQGRMSMKPLYPGREKKAILTPWGMGDLPVFPSD